MSLLDSVKKAVTRTAKDAAKASGELVEQTKLKLKAIEIKDEIDKRYTKIGELYYATVEYELDCGDRMEALVSELKALKSDLENVETEIKKNRKIIKCSSCDSENDAESSYCANCGTALK